MMVFWKARLVMLSVPKTGTTAYEAALAPHADWHISAPPYLKHMPFHTYKNRIETIFSMEGSENFGVFATIRHPVSWLGSWYRYRQRNDILDPQLSTKSVTFDEFVLEYLKLNPAPFANVGNQSRYALHPDGTRAAKHLFKYEHSDEIIAFWQRRLGVSLTVERLNISPPMELALDQDIEAAFAYLRPLEFKAWTLAR